MSEYLQLWDDGRITVTQENYAIPAEDRNRYRAIKLLDGVFYDDGFTGAVHADLLELLERYYADLDAGRDTTDSFLGIEERVLDYDWYAFCGNCWIETDTEEWLENNPPQVSADATDDELEQMATELEVDTEGLQREFYPPIMEYLVGLRDTARSSNDNLDRVYAIDAE